MAYYFNGKMMRRAFYLSVCILVIAVTLRAQLPVGEIKSNESCFLKPASFCVPFVSEVESFATKIEMNYASNNEEYDLSNSGKAYKLFQNTNLGVELPFYSKIVLENNKPVYGFAFSLPIGFQLWWDPLEASTSPVLNAGYKFSTLNFKFIRFFESRIIRNYSFKIAPLNHESTHIGDELTLYRIAKSFPLTRVNVSYEYSEMNLTLNDPNGSFSTNHSLRFGWLYRINGIADYYSLSPAEGDANFSHPTKLKSEVYLQYNLIRDKGFLTAAKWVNVLSVEVRNRVRYNYSEFCVVDGSLVASNISGTRAYTVNACLGWKYKKTNGATLGFYLHAYAGINPYGQFRNQAGFKSLGVSIVLE